MWCERPHTPVFDEELVDLLQRQAAQPRKRLPARLSALRSLRNVNRMGLHAALACGLAATLLLLSPEGIGHQLPLTPNPETSLTPAYLYQYGGPDIEHAIAEARARGYEVQVIRSYVTEASDHQRILSIRHAGTELDQLPGDGARGPLFIVMGLVVGDQLTTAD
jgi:hypothetical protein